MGSRWSVLKIFNDDLKTSSCTLLFKIGTKSFHDLAPVYEVDIKPRVINFELFISDETVWKVKFWDPPRLSAWWRHEMETFSALLAICAGNSPVPGEFSAQRPVTRGFDIFFDLRLNKRLSKQSCGWWFETLSCLLWRHCNVIFTTLGWLLCL